MSRVAIPFSVRVGDVADPSKDLVQIPRELHDRIHAIVIEDHVRKVDKLTLHIDNFDFAVSDSSLFRKKTPIEVTWGFAGAMASPRRFLVESMKGWTQVTVEALAELVQLNDKSRTRLWENMTVSQIVEKLAEEHGYDAVIEDTEVVHEHIAQAGMTDAQFLARLAKREGFEFYMRLGRSSTPAKAKVKSKKTSRGNAKTLHFHRRDFQQAPLRELIWFTSPTGDIISGSFDNDTKGKAGSVTAAARDPKAKKDIKPQVGSNEATTVTALGGERELYVDSRTGAGTAGRSQPAASGVAAVVPSSAKSEKQAKRDADAAYLKVQKSALKLNLTLIGDVTIGAGRIVRVSNIGRRLSGNYYIEKSVHTLDQSGYRTAIDCVRDAHSGYGDKKAVEVKGDVNDKKPDGDSKKLQQRSRSVDAKTGEASEVFWEPKE